MDVLEDVVKMLNTARGKEKMFGYRSQLANRLYLTYFFAGKFLIDSTVGRRTKLAFVLYFMGGYMIGIYIITSYLIFGDKKDVQLLLSIGYGTQTTILAYVILPVLSLHIYGNNLMTAIKMADDIIMKRGNRRKLKNEINLERVAVWIITSLLVSGSFLFFYSPLVMTLFYEPEKTKDFNYYVAYVGNIAEWGSSTYFYISNIVVPVLGTSIFSLWIAMVILVELFAGFCYNEALYIANDLNSLVSEEITSVEMYNKEIEPKFLITLKKCVNDYQDLMRMLNNFQGFYEAFSGFLMPLVFIIELSHVINIILPGTSPIVRVKETGGLFITIIPLFVFCWAGDLLKEMAPTVSFAVYSLPWYWSTTHRKDVYILLCQTQVSTDLKALRVYPIQLGTFLRVLHVIQSTINVLRSVAFK